MKFVYTSDRHRVHVLAVKYFCILFCLPFFLLCYFQNWIPSFFYDNNKNIDKIRFKCMWTAFILAQVKKSVI